MSGDQSNGSVHCGTAPVETCEGPASDVEPLGSLITVPVTSGTKLDLANTALSELGLLGLGSVWKESAGSN